MTEPLDEDQVYKIVAALGRQGGLARAKKLSPERRKEIAIRASRAAAKARIKRAIERKRKKGRQVKDNATRSRKQKTT